MKDSHQPKTNLPLRKEPFRLLALSDGLFATVLTLLVLDLRIPDALDAGGGNMAAIFRWLGPHLFSYLLTFLVAGTYWIGHHRDFDHMVRFDRGLLGYNLLFLLFIGLLPFSTAAIGLGSISSGVSSSYRPIYFTSLWAIYAANIVLAGIMLELTWSYAVSHRLVSPEMTRQQSRYITIRQAVVPGMFLLSIAVEYLFPHAFLGPYTLLAIPLVQWGVDRSFGGGEPQAPSRLPGWQAFLWRAGSMLLWLLVIGLSVWAMTL